MKTGSNLVGRTRFVGSAAGMPAAMIISAFAILLVVTVALAPQALWAADDGANPIVATIGDHQITQREMDAAVLQSISKNQLYELRKQTLNRMIDDYVIEGAAKEAHLTTDAYLARELNDKGRVTEADARKYYDAHKAGIDAQTKGRSFSEIKTPLIAAMQRHEDREHRDALIAKLRTDEHVKVMLEAPRVTVVSTGHPWTGGKDAPVTIVEFSDFQCPYCRAAEPTLKQLRAKYGDKIKLVYMDFPLGMHSHAMDAAVAGHCAADQDKFWQLHDAMFANQAKLDPASLKASAAKLGLNAAKFNTCFDAKTGMAAIKAGQSEGARLGVTGTPTFFVNGREMVGVESEHGFSELIDDELARSKEPQTQANAR